MSKKKKVLPYSPNVRDYPSSLPQYERESLAAEFTIKAKKKASKKKKTPKSVDPVSAHADNGSPAKFTCPP